MAWLRSFFVVPLLASLAIPAGARAQVAGSDIIVGRVVGPDSTPLAGARATITSLATGAAKRILTDAEGGFTVLFRDEGGQYRLNVTFIGMQPANVTIRRRPGQDRLVVTVFMRGTAQELSPVVVREHAEPPLEATFRAGGSERTLSPRLLERLPISAGDLFGTATLVPGVLATAASDTSRSAFSVAAQTSTQNNITVDGLTYLFGSIPQEGVQSTRIIVNAYDVSRGQFTGGQLATTTKSGTRTFQGTATISAHPAATQFTGSRHDAFAQKYSHALFSGAVGGPVGGAGRAYYFLAADAEHRTETAASLTTVRDDALWNLGVARDSLDRFLDALAAIGAATPASIVSPLERTYRSASTLGRLDMDVNATNQLMVRADARGFSEDGGRMSPYAIPSTGGTRRGTGGGGMATLTSVMGQFINEARVYGSWEREDSDPYVRAPGGVVTIASSLDAGREIAALQFGGNQALPRTSRATLYEGNNELTWMLDEGRHRIKLGLLLNRERAEITGARDRYGVFIYNSLADLENNTPALYARTIAGTGRLIGTDNSAIYISHGWQRTPALQVTYGVRLEASRLANAPQSNNLVAAAFLRDTRGFLNEARFYPRLGVSYLMGVKDGVPSGSLSFGLGEFRGRIPSQLLQYVNTNAGFVGTDSVVMCAGSAIPAVTWPSYYADSLSIPTSCAGTSRLPLGSTVPNVAFWGDGAGAPRAWRSALSFEHRIGGRHRLNVDALYAHGIHNPAAEDYNLIYYPLFRLTNELRPVFAHPAAVVQATGVTALAGSRQYPFFGTAYDLGSGVSSRTGQVTVQISGQDQPVIPGLTLGYFNLGYTLMRARDQSNGLPFSDSYATTAADPRTKEWGTSDLERRHSVVATSVVALPRSLELGIIGRVTSGGRYTPMVAGDVNGDGLRNDRAFVFSDAPLLPSQSDTGVIAAMQGLLARTDARARKCLAAQQGRIAGRNSCTLPWHSSLDLQLNWRPSGSAHGRMTVSLIAANALAGADWLLHGSDRIRGWGQPAFPDRILLNATGFDSTSRTFRYTVNDHFGNRGGAANPFRVPFRLGLQVRFRLGSEITNPPLERSRRWRD